MRMVMKIDDSGRISYAIQNLYRLVYAVFCIAIGGGLVIAVSERSLMPSAIIPLLLFVLGLLGLAYRERWVFDPKKRQIESLFGVAICTKKETIGLDRVKRIEINHFVRGTLAGSPPVNPKGRNKSMVVFSIILHDDSKRDVEIIPEKVSAGRTEKAARAIALALDIPFHADREYDSVQKVTMRDV